MGNNGRDVEVIRLGGGQCLVVACDSCGGVGSKELDVVRVPPAVVGRFTARVALFEVMAAGAHPKAISVTISNEPSPTGNEILQGVRDEMSDLDAACLPIAVSTEKNMPTRQTAVGVTVIGACAGKDLKLGLSRPGDHLYCLGVPKVGDEVGKPDDDGTVRIRHMRILLNTEGIHDIIPVGSKGIRREAEALAHAVDGKLTLETDLKLDLSKSGGPSSCVLFSCLPGSVLPVFDALSLTRIGKLES